MFVRLSAWRQRILTLSKLKIWNLKVICSAEVENSWENTISSTVLELASRVLILILNLFSPNEYMAVKKNF